MYIVLYCNVFKENLFKTLQWRKSCGRELQELYETSWTSVGIYYLLLPSIQRYGDNVSFDEIEDKY